MGLRSWIKKKAKKLYKKAKGLVKKIFKKVTQPFGFSPDIPDFGMDEGFDQTSLIQGVLVNKDSATATIPVVYGKRMIGGVRVFVATGGDTNKYLYVAHVLSEGQINGVTKLMIDDNEIEIGALTHGTEMSPTGGKHQGRLTVQFFDGRDTQSMASLLSAASGWTVDHTLSGIAYLALRFEWKKVTTQAEADANPYGGGVPNIKVVVEGKKIFNAAGLGSSHTTAYADETVAYYNNPVSILLDYMRNSRYGKGLSNDSFNWATWNTAADLCDQVINYTATTTGKAFTCDAVVDTSFSLMSNIKIILSGFRGIMPYTQGKYKLMIEHAGDDTDITSTSTPSTVFTVTNDHIIGGMSLQGETKESKINRCIVTYVDPDSDYQPNQAVYPIDGSADDTTFLAEDNSVRLEKTVVLPTVANREQALQFGEVFVKRSRSSKSISFNTTIATSNTTVGDLITVVNEHIGLSGIFRIYDIRIDVDGFVSIDATEHQSATYAIIAKPEDIVRPVIVLPDPLISKPVTGLSYFADTQHCRMGGGLHTQIYWPPIPIAGWLYFTPSDDANVASYRLSIYQEWLLKYKSPSVRIIPVGEVNEIAGTTGRYTGQATTDLEIPIHWRWFDDAGIIQWANQTTIFELQSVNEYGVISEMASLSFVGRLTIPSNTIPPIGFLPVDLREP